MKDFKNYKIRLKFGISLKKYSFLLKRYHWLSLCSFIFTFIYSTLFFSSCSGISLSQRIIIRDKDWLMCGGSPLQQNVSKYVLEPPFNLMWTYDCDAGIGNAAVTASDAVIFVNTLNGEMHSIDLSSGKKIGYLSFLGGEASTAPLIIQDGVIVSYSGDNKYSLTSYDLLSKRIDWRINLGYIQTSPILADDYIYIGSLGGREYKISQSAGNIIWDFNAKSQIHSTCAVKDNKLVFGADNGFIYCLNTNDGTELWKFKTGESIVSAPLIFDNDVYFGSYDSVYYSINLDSGKVKWQNNLKTKFYSGSALYENKNIIAGGIDGVLYSLDVNDGHVIWNYHTNGVIQCTPLVSGKNVYFTSFDWYLYCLDCDSGKMIWNYQLDGKGRTTPVIWKDYLFVPADKYIYCFTKNEVK